MENYSSWGAAVMKMAVEMAAVSMEKPSGALPVRQGRNRLCPPDLGFAMVAALEGDQELVVTSYTDASWNTDPDDSKSQSGYVFILNGAAVSWMSAKQCTVAKSSTESEYIAASEASSEEIWMKRFITELGVVPSALNPLVIYCDKMGAIAYAQDPRSHKKLKHIKLRFHVIHELGEALQEFLLHHHHTVVLLGFRGQLPHLRCPVERGEDGLHRHHYQNNTDETNEGAENTEDVYYEEPKLSGGVDEVDYLIEYGTEEANEEA
ncbi:hypothetical protein QYE76_011866 [Lolium multiflorum]|uniref:Retrotransposon protein, putative, Ty1-copia subclass n=1 Tax=Lolium multiflorum TaxID=4521 RepID=A0AAD8TZZ9_LOLMU|nr:hypothetical protein QYE76_011866 [Lolium multiflorum]